MDPISPLIDLWARRLMEQRMREVDIMSPEYGALPDNLGATPMPHVRIPENIPEDMIFHSGGGSSKHRGYF